MRTTKLIFNFEQLHALPHLTHTSQHKPWQRFWAVMLGDLRKRALSVDPPG